LLVGCGETRLSSLFEVPAQLAMLLSLAASTAGHEPLAAVGAAELAAPAADFAVVSEPLEGPLRFGERAWMRALHENPAEAGANGYAGRVFVTSGGRFYVPTAGDRRRILDARNDAALASRLARAAADRNAVRMHTALHRAPTAGDLYIAHVFGPETAVSLVRAAGEEPNAVLKKRFPELANLAVESAGGAASAITVEQFYRRLSGSLHEPPRLIAIGLKPTVADTLQMDLTTKQAEGPTTVAWQAKVNLAKSARPVQ
jgi:hypothetical protein